MCFSVSVRSALTYFIASANICHVVLRKPIVFTNGVMAHPALCFSLACSNHYENMTQYISPCRRIADIKPDTGTVE